MKQNRSIPTRKTVKAPKNHLKGTKGGRPLGTKKMFHFSKTKIGFFLLYETPVVYDLIMGDNDVRKYYYAPTVEDIVKYTSASNDVAFLKPKFFRYLEEYRKNGLCCGRPKEITKERIEYYTKIQNQKLVDLSRDVKNNIDYKTNRDKHIRKLSFR